MLVEPERAVFVGVLLSVYFLCFWVHFWVLQHAERAGWWARHKIQPGAKEDPALVREAITHAVASHGISVPLAAWFGYDYFSARGMSFALAPLDLGTLGSACCTLAVWHALFDTWFYWTHRLLHHERIYKYVHKQHHRFKTPVGVAAVFAHPVEDLVVSLPSTFIGPLLYRPGSHFALFALYIGLRFHETVDAHSGYALPWSPWRWLGAMHGGAGRHDWHHSHQVGCYGGFTFWDWFCGTDKAYRAWKKQQQQQPSPSTKKVQKEQ
jgi:sterol desaturase/sphingolipid hydroxylase (fatty acid hydroxylase superfamily)